LTSRDVIDHMTIRPTVSGFLSVVYCNQPSISHCYWDIMRHLLSTGYRCYMMAVSQSSWFYCLVFGGSVLGTIWFMVELFDIVTFFSYDCHDYADDMHVWHPEATANQRASIQQCLYVPLKMHWEWWKLKVK